MEGVLQAPLIFDALKKWIADDNRPQEQVDRFVERWRRLRDHDSLPCPSCFLDRATDQPLTALPAQGAYEPVLCPACRTTYYPANPTPGE
jgi:hypothetical protein